MVDAAAARDRLCDPASEVSAHWLLHEDGTAEPLVAEDRRAWHAGAGSWQGREDVNSRSIGIEIVNPGDRPFPAAQMAGLERLLRDIMARWGIGPAGVIGHSDMAPGRKLDPGPRLDWRRLGRAGLAIWPGDAPSDSPAELDAILTRIGYPPAPVDLRLAAFRARFRPGAAGPVSDRDRIVAAAVLRQIDAATTCRA
ncbi:N-acetylmuramoyl-L-alanine amidase [uncultured Paracoccus sp.]|uniref:N-acetylmuramoyl-L-alanine amidase n=1 Tax=uncultured Paracoccus sp. TaxID=189685 RepID=UPI00261EA32C|nr:N-acetylmuramoyl-L-alanine amidase [uncultured Paracoccus sp.]